MRNIKHLGKLISIFCVVTLAVGCGDVSVRPNDTVSSDHPANDSFLSGTKPDIKIPNASGKLVKDNKYASIDYSNCSEGYVFVSYFGSSPKVKMRITGPDSVTYTYDFGNCQDSFPLTAGSGKYKVEVFEIIEGTEYSTVFSASFNADINDEMSVFLYPSHMVAFDASGTAVKKADEFYDESSSELELIDKILDYVTSNVSYDCELAETATGSYIPNADNTIARGKGICSDYATLMTVMLRSQGIPARLEVGYADDAYHEWLSIHTNEYGWVRNLLEFDGEKWVLTDPTFIDNMGNKAYKKLIGEGNIYTVKYIY